MSQMDAISMSLVKPTQYSLPILRSHPSSPIVMLSGQFLSSEFGLLMQTCTIDAWDLTRDWGEVLCPEGVGWFHLSDLQLLSQQDVPK